MHRKDRHMNEVVSEVNYSIFVSEEIYSMLVISAFRDLGLSDLGLFW